jgi:hypothetical protein
MLYDDDDDDDDDDEISDKSDSDFVGEFGLGRKSTLVWQSVFLDFDIYDPISRCRLLFC